jgi:hypothetical protein
MYHLKEFHNAHRKARYHHYQASKKIDNDIKQCHTDCAECYLKLAMTHFKYLTPEERDIISSKQVNSIKERTMKNSRSRTIYFASGDSSLSQGSFYKFISRSSTYSHYILGDYQGVVREVPKELMGYTKGVAKQILPKGLY